MMNTKLFGSTIGRDDDLFTLEEKLHGILIPVTPRSDFVHELHHRLVRRNFIFDLVPQRIQSILFILGGVVGSFAILIMGFRAVLSLVSVIGIVRQQYRNYKTQVNKSRPVSTPSPVSS
jgi:hypothetical protein